MKVLHLRSAKLPVKTSYAILLPPPPLTSHMTVKRSTSDGLTSVLPPTILLIAALLLSPAVLAQNPPPTPSAADVRQTYAKLCAGCHGADARGSQQGPGLAGNPGVRRRSPQNLRNVILKGIPAAGMPPFELPAPTIDALAALVASFNASAGDTTVPGDRAAGKEFFFGRGHCASCHMVFGDGAPSGPDLSNVALDRTVDQLREALPRIVDLRCDDEIAILRGEHAVYGRLRQVVAGLHRDFPAAGQRVALHGVFVHRHHAVVQREIDVLAAA